jgi:hypothetical protein
MSVLTDVLRDVHGAVVRGVLLPGHLEREQGELRHVTWGSVAYLELDPGLLRLTSVGNGGGLELTRTDRITPIDGLDDEFCVTSIGSHFFEGELPITRIRYAMNGESDAGRGVVRCAEFELGGHLRLFADPLWIHGIRIGVSNGYHNWQREDRERERTTFSFVEEGVWPPAESAGPGCNPATPAGV